MSKKDNKDSSKVKLPDDFGKDLTPDETDRLTKAFQQKEFRDLFFQYMQEISQPGAMEEYEKMISQAEEINKENQAQLNTAKQTLHPQPTSATSGLSQSQKKSKSKENKQNKIQPKPKENNEKDANKKKNSNKVESKQTKFESATSDLQNEKKKQTQQKVQEITKQEITKEKEKPKTKNSLYPTIPKYEKIYVQDFNMADYTLV